MTSVFGTLSFLILKYIRIYNNHFHLVRIITLGEKPQAEERWRAGDLQTPHVTTPQPVGWVRAP